MATNWQIGDKIENRWEVHKILRGGMGIVYVVYDHEFREAFAAKTFRDEVFARNPAIPERFMQEALAWVNLDIHQNITQARFAVNIIGKPYLFLEYVAGGDLDTWIRTPRSTDGLQEVFGFAIQFCDGMIHANSKGIKAHRDIKPQNCLITEDGTLKVTDFGLAKVFDDTGTARRETGRVGERESGSMGKGESGRGGLFGRLFGRRHGGDPTPTPNVQCLSIGLSQTGTAAGTCTHMAPEQFGDAKHVDVRADVYSFGVMLFQMIEGRLPFTGRTWQEFECLHKTQPPPPLNAQYSVLHPVISTCLSKEPCGRFASFQQIRDELAVQYRRFVGTEAPSAPVGNHLNASQLNVKVFSLNNLGKHEQALECAERALNLRPDYVDCMVNKAVALHALGHCTQALECCDRAVALNPQAKLAWHNKGDVLSDMGRREEGIASFDQAIRIDPHFYQAWFNKGIRLGEMGRHREALSCHERAIVLNPRDEQIWISMGAELGAMGMHEEAIGCFDRAIALRPNYAEAWDNKAMALCTLGRMSDSIHCFDKAIAVHPAFADAFYNKGVALSRMGNHDEAIQCYERAIEFRPDFALAWYNKGVALGERLGLWGEAVSCYDQALKINPSHKEAWYNKGVSLVNGLKQYGEAMTCFQRGASLGDARAANAIDYCRERLGKV